MDILIYIILPMRRQLMLHEKIKKESKAIQLLEKQRKNLLKRHNFNFKTSYGLHTITTIFKQVHNENEKRAMIILYKKIDEHTYHIKKKYKILEFLKPKYYIT